MTASCDVMRRIAPTVVGQLQEQLQKISFLQGRRVIVLAGPTGVGKTTISLHLAQMLKGEIVSADSMCVYKGMDIGTAKVSREDRDKIPHHLIDVCDLTDPFNVCDYCAQAHQAIEDILRRGTVPIIVGGTGFYIHHLLYGPPIGPPSDPQLRQSLEAEGEMVGYDVLYARLEQMDPCYAQSITPNDRHKIVRALEIMKLSGRCVSDFPRGEARTKFLKYDYRAWFLNMPRNLLKERLSLRCEEMLSNRFLDEVVELSNQGLLENHVANSAIGYRQAIEYLQTNRTQKEYENFVERFKIASYHLAKRQCTWFKKEPLFRWVDISTIPEEYLLDMIASDYSSPTPFAPKSGPTPPFLTI
jgi:tRNA dimethylallyltransferase